MSDLYNEYNEDHTHGRLKQERDSKVYKSKVCGCFVKVWSIGDFREFRVTPCRQHEKENYVPAVLVRILSEIELEGERDYCV